MENTKYENENIERKYLKTPINHFLEFKELKDRKRKRDIEELFSIFYLN